MGGCVMQENLQYIITQFLVGSYHCLKIVNIDETNIFFHMVGAGLTLNYQLKHQWQHALHSVVGRFHVWRETCSSCCFQRST